MLFEYPSGISAFFPHEDLSIEQHKREIIKETEEKLKELIENYGNGIVEKIIANRKKWDSDYSAAFEKISKEVDGMKKNTKEEFDGNDWPGQEKCKVPKRLNEFIEGKTVLEVAVSRTDMKKCMKKCVKTFLRCMEEDIEISLEF